MRTQGLTAANSTMGRLDTAGPAPKPSGRASDPAAT